MLWRSISRGSTAYWELAVTGYRLVLIILCTVRYILPDLTFDPFGLDFEPQAIVDAHILICYPDQREQRNQVSAPVGEQQFESSDEQEQGGNVMAEAVLAGEEIEEFSLVPAKAVVTATFAVLAWFAKDFFVRHGPGNARDRNCQHKQFDDLQPQRRHRFDCNRAAAAPDEASTPKY